MLTCGRAVDRQQPAAVDARGAAESRHAVQQRPEPARDAVDGVQYGHWSRAESDRSRLAKGAAYALGRMGVVSCCNMDQHISEPNAYRAAVRKWRADATVDGNDVGMPGGGRGVPWKRPNCNEI